MLELARDPPTGRHEALEVRMVLRRALEHGGRRMRDIVDAGAGQPCSLEPVRRCVQLAATVFEGGCRSAHLRDKPLEHLGNRVARPGIGHRDRDAVDVMQGRGATLEVMVMGIKS